MNRATKTLLRYIKRVIKNSRKLEDIKRTKFKVNYKVDYNGKECIDILHGNNSIFHIESELNAELNIIAKTLKKWFSKQ